MKTLLRVPLPNPLLAANPVATKATGYHSTFRVCRKGKTGGKKGAVQQWAVPFLALLLRQLLVANPSNRIAHQRRGRGCDYDWHDHGGGQCIPNP